MKFGFRTPSIKKSFSARTTGKLKRTVKKAVMPMYGKKGVGLLTNPKKAVYNKVYRKTTWGVGDILNTSKKSKHSFTTKKKVSANRTSYNYKKDNNTIPISAPAKNSSKKKARLTLYVFAFFIFLASGAFSSGDTIWGIVILIGVIVAGLILIKKRNVSKLKNDLPNAIETD